MSKEKQEKQEKNQTNEKCFHTEGAYHDTYARQAHYVAGLGNQWATENFNATRPYFA